MSTAASPFQSVPYWLYAIRPKTLLTGLAPVIIGGTLGFDRLESVSETTLALFLGCLVTVVLLQAGANLVNDAKDFELAVDHAGRQGPQRMAAQGLLSVSALKWGYHFCFSIAFCLGSIISFLAGWPLLLLGLACIVAAYFYSAGSRPLSHLGLGELVALTFFGPVATAGTVFAVTSSFNLSDLIWGVPPGMFAAAMMAVNNVRDQVSDRAAAKTTLAVWLGPKHSVKMPTILVLMGLVWFFLAAGFLKGWTPQLLALTAILFGLCGSSILPQLWPQGGNYARALPLLGAFNLVYAVLFLVWWGPWR